MPYKDYQLPCESPKSVITLGIPCGAPRISLYYFYNAPYNAATARLFPRNPFHDGRIGLIDSADKGVKMQCNFNIIGRNGLAQNHFICSRYRVTWTE